MITAERLRELVSYDKETGKFVWIKKKARRNPGDIAGSFSSHGYIRIGIDGVEYQAHRLAWLYVYGEWPIGLIDHINCDKVDNRICNLRSANRSENNANAKKRRRNTSGFKGVSWHRDSRKWQALINAYGKRHNLGVFLSAEEAHDAYCKAAYELYGEFARTE